MAHAQQDPSIKPSIPQMLALVQAFWMLHPELRLGQLLCVVWDDDLFYVSDELLMQRLQSELAKASV